MEFDKNKFALSAATTMTLVKAIKMFLWQPFFWRMPMFRGAMWRYHHGFGVKHFPTSLKEAMPTCPGYYPAVSIIVVFIGTFAATWFFAWFYNWLVSKK